jgi:3-methyladenine DNA glycosylase Mpg
VTLADNGRDLTTGALTIRPPAGPRRFSIARGPRVGVTRAVARPLRFWVAENRFVSKL